jgi:hypothetical protein
MNRCNLATCTPFLAPKLGITNPDQIPLIFIVRWQLSINDDIWIETQAQQILVWYSVVQISQG